MCVCDDAELEVRSAANVSPEHSSRENENLAFCSADARLQLAGGSTTESHEHRLLLTNISMNISCFS